jgi:hypothetical protein
VHPIFYGCAGCRSKRHMAACLVPAVRIV